VVPLKVTTKRTAKAGGKIGNNGGKKKENKINANLIEDLPHQC
jgi:hypothetical protein